MDLCDLYRGAISARKVATFIWMLKPGSRLAIERGGPGAWSAEVRAIHEEGYRTMIGGYAGSGVKRAQVPKPIEPPPEGWLKASEEKQDRQAQKAARWAQRQDAH
ncbi:hypothetical protein [Pseudoclavibacter sp. AY1H1]|uniref:hypothetical protein n=1 Tax=Pseudoclavibacter sp. AY1H1 TaxID=2080584 RepID=UPI000CE81F97|nr:hypothetical protein [Pseudoclavibacter sp. AY1H1]PPF39977.1 hypothetical protein C5E05_01830 [Pseudoclavibacter sp. AY1H1]